mmetsp:Transcript_26586/g.61064  ORF Transcript_26586/g.61064 Transcript_26586/m.61064 type:complete len:316 (-) Transcript_26586:23-970(-)
MKIPEHYRCCVCLSACDQVLVTACPHKLCQPCVEGGSLLCCPVCKTNLPERSQVDTAFAEEIRLATLVCECGATLPVLEAEAHECDMSRATSQQSLPPPHLKKPPVANISTFSCPICKAANLTTKGLLEHCEKQHTGQRPVAAVCPICAVMPWGDPNYVSGDWLRHLKLRHRCDYETLTDFAEDEEAILARVLAQSALEVNSAQVPTWSNDGAFLADEDDDSILARVLQESAMEHLPPAERSDRDTDAEEESSEEDDLPLGDDRDRGDDTEELLNQPIRDPDGGDRAKVLEVDLACGAESAEILARAPKRQRENE